MIKTMLWPFFKRFFGLFISMTFVSLLAVGLLCCFGSTIIDTRNKYQAFVAENQNVDELVSTEFTIRSTLMKAVDDIEEIDSADARLVIDCYLRNQNANSKEERTIVARVFSYNENNTLFHTTSISGKAVINNNYINIAVAEKFARNNNFKVGDVVELGFLNMWKQFHISEIVDTPEAIYPRANNYIWSDNSDFGYIYAKENELDKGLKQLATAALDKAEEDSFYKEYIEKAMQEAGITIPVLEAIINEGNYVNRFANQLLVKNAKGTTTSIVTEKLNKYFEDEGVDVKSVVLRDYLPHIAYMNHALDQVQVAAIFLPVFFYSITMIVIGLFINQIIKTMTPQIGVFMSIGIGNGAIVGLFLIFTTIMALTAGALGAPVGYALSFLMASMMRKTYTIPTIAGGLNALVVVGAIIGLLLFTVVTTLIATRAIFRITPKDATISNEAKRKSMPKPIQKFIDKAPMTIKLGVNSIVQNPRRFFVSSFSIFASLVLILMSSFFYVSKNEMIDQSINRRLNYDAQIYLTERVKDDTEDNRKFLEGLKEQARSPEEFEECYYTYLKANKQGNADNSVYLECLAVDPGYNKLITIPTSNGRDLFNKKGLAVPETGILLPKSHAETLKVKKGDSIEVNGVALKVMGISFQYFHPITYLSKAQMEVLEAAGTENIVTSFILNVPRNEDNSKKTGALLKYLSDNRNQSLTVFTDSLSKDLHSIFDSTDTMIYIMIGFSLAMAFIILCIMSQNALMEQQRQLTIFRAIGFTVLNISNVWTLQSVGQLLVSSVLGIPVGALAIYILLRMCSSATQTYPFIFSGIVVLIAMGFVLGVVVACHLISMRSIKRWNIADNTRCRE